MPEAMAADAATLVREFRRDPRLNAESLRLLARLLREQCDAVTGEEGAGLRSDSMIPGTSPPTVSGARMTPKRPTAGQGR
jgi:hypothetical protein